MAKYFIMLAISLVAIGAQIGVLLWCLERLKKHQKLRWGEKA